MRSPDQIESLRNILGRYLLHAFAMNDYQDLHFGETVDGLDQEFVDQILGVVDERARSICAAVASDRASRDTAAS